MDTYQQTCQWFRKLGYDGDFPENFDRICNKATSFVWDQLVQNCKSKVEVSTMRKKILFSRLPKDVCNKQQESQYPLEEINLYLKKKELEKELLNISCPLKEKQNTNLNILNQNKLKRFSIQKINLKIKESEEREFLLREKLKILENDIIDAEDILNYSINGSLTVQEDTLNCKDITQTLNLCETKLQEDVKQLPLPSRKTSNEISRLLGSSQKSARKNNVFEKYMTLTEKQTAKKIKRCRDKENTGSRRVNVRLFSGDSSIHSNLQKSVLTDKRDSIELNFECRDDENFLVDLNKASFLAPPSNHRFDLFSPMSAKKKWNSTSLFRESENYDVKNHMNESLVKKMFNESISKDINNLLHHSNRQNIWNIFQTIDENLQFIISKKINFRNIKFPSVKLLRIEDVARLQSLHVTTEFKIIKNHLILRQLAEKVNKKKEDVILLLANSGYPNDIIDNLQKNLELEIEDVGLDCTIEVMKREINKIQRTAEIADTSEIKKALSDIKTGINLKRIAVIHYLDIIQELFLHINQIRSTTSSCVRKLAPYSSDLVWCSLLAEKNYVGEITTFERFPIEYNRKSFNTDSDLYYRDIHTDRFLLNNEVGNEQLQTLSYVLESPFSAPETLILNILRAKCKLEALQSMKYSEDNGTYKKYSAKELEARESYITNMLEQFYGLSTSSISAKTLSATNVTKKIMDIWIGTPFKEFISPNRTLDDKDFKYYEKVFDSFYNNL